MNHVIMANHMISLITSSTTTPKPQLTQIKQYNVIDIHAFFSRLQCRIYHCTYVCTGPCLHANFFTMDFCLCGAILNLKAFLNFLSIYA